MAPRKASSKTAAWVPDGTSIAETMMFVSKTTRLMGGLADLLGATATDCRDLSIDLAHRDFVRSATLGRRPGFLEPSRSVGAKLFQESFPLRLAAGNAVDDGLWCVGDSAAFRLRLQYVASADAELLPYGLGNDHLVFIFYGDNRH